MEPQKKYGHHEMEQKPVDPDCPPTLVYKQRAPRRRHNQADNNTAMRTFAVREAGSKRIRRGFNLIFILDICFRRDGQPKVSDSFQRLGNY